MNIKKTIIETILVILALSFFILFSYFPFVLAYENTTTVNTTTYELPTEFSKTVNDIFGSFN